MICILRTGGGRFRPEEDALYFLAGDTRRHQQGEQVARYLLVALNEVESQGSLTFLEQTLTNPAKCVLLDSGVFSLASAYAHVHHVPLSHALTVAPHEMEGFDSLFERYVDLVKRHEHQLWGYIEIDQGGQYHKQRTRARLEGLGLRPIPVYHPFSDEPSYFDELAQRYDRLCIGNLATAPNKVRLRVLATIWQRRKQYPHLWIHVLGVSPNWWSLAYPMNSCDSSAWLAPLRFPRNVVYVDGYPYDELGPGYRYQLGSDVEGPRGAHKCVALNAYLAHMQGLTWRSHLRSIHTDGEPYAC
jgi:hypothetical protein